MKITDIKCYVLSHEGGPPAFHWRQGLRVPDFTGHTMYSFQRGFRQHPDIRLASWYDACSVAGCLDGGRFFP